MLKVVPLLDGQQVEARFSHQGVVFNVVGIPRMRKVFLEQESGGRLLMAEGARKLGRLLMTVAYFAEYGVLPPWLTTEEEVVIQ